MEIYRHLDNYDRRPSAVTIGMFDGLHLGHRALIDRLVAEAHERGLLSVVITFATHPKVELSKGNDKVRMLTTLDERQQQICRLGVDRLIILPFTRGFSDLTAQQFIRQYLCDLIGARYLLMGYNHRFGSDSLQPDDYKRIATAEGLDLGRAARVMLDDNIKVSSSEVRRVLEAGDVSLAARLLGRPYVISGEVVHGDAIGRTLGFPTANIAVSDPDKLIPADGVYAAMASPDAGDTLKAVVNIGTRPTVGGDGRRIEAHLIDFEKDIYTSHINLQLCGKIRNEETFNDLNELKAQIERDIKKAKNIIIAPNLFINTL